MRVSSPNRAAAAEAPFWLSPDQMAARPGRVPSLDGLRAASILIVLAAHFINRNLFPGGLGVYVFFVISGFLITRLLLAELKWSGEVSLPRFYGRRALRLYPVVIVYTLVVVVGMLALNRPFNVIEPISSLFYFSNYYYYYHSAPTAPFSIFWSLSVEEHFYLLLPALIFFVRSARHTLWFAGGVIFACLAFRLGAAITHPELLSTRFFYYRTECRLDSLAYGVAVACLCESEKGRRLLLALARPTVAVAALVGVLFCLLYRDAFFRETWRYSVLGVCISLGLIYVLFRGGWAARVLNIKPLIVIGLMSYSLYVWHLIAPDVLGLAGVHASRPVDIALRFIVAFALAAASYFGFEKPLLGLRQKLQARSPKGRKMPEGTAAVALHDGGLEPEPLDTAGSGGATQRGRAFE